MGYRARAKNHYTKLDSYIKYNGAKKTDDVITAILVMNLDDRTSDIEIFVAIDKAIPSTKEFTYMPACELSNCIKIKYSDSFHLGSVPTMKM